MVSVEVARNKSGLPGGGDMPRMKLTKAAIDSLQITDNERVTYWDTELTGFCVRASQTAKTYYAKERVKGKPFWLKIGEHGLLTPDLARRDARTH